MKRGVLAAILIGLILPVGLSGVSWAGFPKKFAFRCSGSESGAGIGEAGIFQFNSPTVIVGSAELNYGDGLIIEFTSFDSGTIVNGTADAEGNGGNAIPTGCFTGTAFFSGDVFGVNTAFFGCYSDKGHQFDTVQTISGSALTCHGIQM